jgi:hypothetical protein
MEKHWAAEEMSDIDLGDKRLNKRSVKLLERLGEKPAMSIPQACKGWAETQAAYRFFAQEDIGWKDILRPHINCTNQRMKGRAVVLCIQDTTEVDFNGQEINGLGSLSYDAQRGLYLHPTYAVSPEREPLGLLDAWIWVRDKKGELSRSLPQGTKESCRWVEGYKRLAEQALHQPDTRWVYVADREGDFIDLMVQAQIMGTPVDWLIRAVHNRKIVGQEDKLWDGFSNEHILGEIRFSLPAKNGQAAREVRQQVSSRRCTLPSAKGELIEITALWAQEIGAPVNIKALEWRLLTNRCAHTLEVATELIDWYRCRWEIEIFFHVLKNGCKVEALQLSSIERLELVLAFFMIIAWRIQMLMRLGRTCPEMDCEAVFDPQEWHAAYIVARKPIPKKPPPLNAVIRLIASFGGFLGRKCDGQPGVKTLWTGLQRVMDFAMAIHSERSRDSCTCV